MYLRKAQVLAALLFLVLGVGSAQADVTYLLEFQGASLYDPGTGEPVDEDQNGEPDPYGGTFLVTVPTVITTAISLAADSCSLSPNADVYYDCAPTQAFDPDGFGTGLNFIGFQTVSASGSGQGFLFFPAGSFLANGIYQLAPGLPYVGTGGNLYGNFASTATLTVSGVGDSTRVPEPATLALLGLGLAALGFARRNR